MKRFSILISVIIAAGCTSNGNDTENEEDKTELNDDPNRSNKVEDKVVEDFIPPDMMLIEEAEGHLNNDDLLDHVLVLKMIDEDGDDLSELKRHLMIIIGDENHGLMLMVDNPNILFCKSCGGVFGDPYDALAIDEKSFSISHYGGSADRWSRTATFEYNEELDDWVIKEDLGTYFSAIESDSDTAYTYYNKEQYGITLFVDYSTE